MTIAEFVTEYRLRLTDQQLAAVQSVDEPTLLLAVPGSGKTTVLVTRLGYLIRCCGVEPEKILTVTYTVAATADMKKRFASVFCGENAGRQSEAADIFEGRNADRQSEAADLFAGGNVDRQVESACVFGENLANRMQFRTINGICYSILRYYEQHSGKTMYQLVPDDGSKVRLLSEIYRKLKNDFPSESDLKELSTQITYIKNMQLSEKEILKYGGDDGPFLLKVYAAYGRTMKERRQMDFDDQMVYALKLLRLIPDLLAHFREMYPYICVDEAQDTSKIQHEILALLAGDGKHLFMVGDEDQSIYGFRAAYPEALLEFEKNYPGARVLLMEQNFRSNAKIVQAADRFIQKNELRHPKTMRATRPEGAEIRVVDIKGRGAQYTYLAKVAADVMQRTGYTASLPGTRAADWNSMWGENETADSVDSKDMGNDQLDTRMLSDSSRKSYVWRNLPATAVLYRDNESALPLIDLLERREIPYRIRQADLTFFSHRVVMDIRNIIRFAQDPTDTDAFLQIYYKIGTYMSKAAALEACHQSSRRQLPVLEAAERYCDLAAGTRRGIPELRANLRIVRTGSAVDALNCIRFQMGYDAYLERSHIKDTKLQILRALALNEESAQGLVERLDELSGILQTKEADYNCPFVLSTIHSSKGLEYDTVYLIDVEDGLFPENVVADRRHASKEEIRAYEEERRLFYVGVTRAKEQLVIFRQNDGSTFCRELLGQRTKSEAVAAAMAAYQSGSSSRSGFEKDGVYYFGSRYENNGRRNGSNRIHDFDDDGYEPPSEPSRVLKSMPRKKKKQPLQKVTDYDLEEKVRELQETKRMRHRILGDGEVLKIFGDSVQVRFEDRTVRIMLKYAMERGLIE